MGLDILGLPDNPPQKWLNEGFNTCRLGLRCGGVSDLIIKNFPNTDKLHMSISKLNHSYLVSLKSESALIEFNTKHPLLGGPSVYINGSN